jgi:hypothetical protein
MSKEKRPEKLQQELALLNADKSLKQVAFNQKTGELEVIDSPREVAADATIITSVATGGFANK